MITAIRIENLRSLKVVLRCAARGLGGDSESDADGGEGGAGHYERECAVERGE